MHYPSTENNKFEEMYEKQTNNNAVDPHTFN